MPLPQASLPIFIRTFCTSSWPLRQVMASSDAAPVSQPQQHVQASIASLHHPLRTPLLSYSIGKIPLVFHTYTSKNMHISQNNISFS